MSCLEGARWPFVPALWAAVDSGVSFSGGDGQSPETCAPTAPVSGAVGSWLFACGAGVDLLFPFRVNLGGVGGTPRELPSLSPGDLRGRRVLLWQREVLSGPPQLSPTPNHRGC